VGVKVMGQKVQRIIKVLTLEKGTADIHTHKHNQSGHWFGEKSVRKAARQAKKHSEKNRTGQYF